MASYYQKRLISSIDGVMFNLMKSRHYAWVIVGVGVLVKMACLGFGRFAYSLLLPYMRTSLGFNYSQMGLLSGGILLGYLLFSFIGGVLATRFGLKRVIIASLLCSSISMLFISRLSLFFSLFVSTFAMGAAAAGAHISMTVLPMAWFEQRSVGRAVGIVTGGSGLGVLLTGILDPYLLTNGGQEAWRSCWLLLASITFAVAVIAVFLLKETPREREISVAEPTKEAALAPPKKGQLSLRAIFVIYFIFGFAYIIYATYFPAFMVEDIHLSEKSAGDIWAIFGWMCMLSGLAWGFLSDRFGRRKALLWNNVLISLSVLLPLLFHQPFILSLSAFLFGFTFLGTVTVIAASVGDHVGEKKASTYGLVTLIHGIGQFLGTTSGGTLKDLTGSFQITLLSSLTGFTLCLILIVLGKRRG
jgi:MFS family permease